MMRMQFIFLMVVLAGRAFAQVQDTTSVDWFNANSSLLSNHKKQIHYVVRGKVVLAMSKLVLAPVEDQIFNLEVQECNAVLKRDTSILKDLWQRDFTLDNSAKELVRDKNPLPYYASLGRMIDKLTVMENIVFVSGSETYQEIEHDGKLSEMSKRNFFHTWTSKQGKWILTTRSNE